MSEKITKVEVSNIGTFFIAVWLMLIAMGLMGVNERLDTQNSILRQQVAATEQYTAAYMVANDLEYKK
jgi:hypothetical protein